MLLRLKASPHCNNCSNLKKKRKHFHCKGHWKDKVHPEHSGHIHSKIDDAVSDYHIVCRSYSPKRHIRH